MTYSIVARDRDTGELGVGVQSRAFNTGAVVPWARAGVGAVATQAFGERRYGYRGLELMSTGIPPADALAQLRDADDRAEYRQVAMIDAAGTTAQHTGGACIEAAGHTSGAGWAAQANMVDSQRVWESMGEAFESASGTLARRLLAALDAAQAAGGDWRGMQAGGILVVPAEGEPWERVVDLRVDDSDAPLTELRRRRVGFVFQFFHLIPELTGAENVTLPARLAGAGAGADARARALIERLGVAEASSRLPGVLSGGEQQRLAVARALVNDPVLVLADEPTGNLDEESGHQVLQLLRSLADEGRSVLLVTHEPEAAAIADRVLHLRVLA